MQRKPKSYRSFAVCLVMSTLLVIWFVPACFAVDAVEAGSTIDQAERDLGSAFAMVVEAEGAGADVSVLLNKLSSASDFLSEAYVAFRAGNYENASLLANECSHAVEGITGDAARLKEDAERTSNDGLLLTVTESGVGLVLLLVLGFLGWKLLKRWYFRRVLDVKPQVEGAQ